MSYEYCASYLNDIGFNLYPNSGELAEYKNGFTVMRIDGRDSSIEFTNGIKLFAGDVIGAVSEAQMRRIQIRETILSHLERERQLFYKGTKVLSLVHLSESTIQTGRLRSMRVR